MGKKNRKRREEQPDESFSPVNPFGSLDLDLPPGEPTQEPEASSEPQRLHLHVYFARKGRGGKTVTLVEGYPTGAPSADLERFARELRQALAVGGTVRDGVIELQGELVCRTAEYLRAQGHTVKGA